MSASLPRRIHASCVAIGGRAVLIGGKSGAGKSDLALRLIDRGAVLVSDDYTELSFDGDVLRAGPPEAIEGHLELRGIGILTRPFVRDVRVALLIDLNRAPERLPEPFVTDIGSVGVPTIALRALEPSAPIKVEAALQLYGLTFPCPP